MCEPVCHPHWEQLTKNLYQLVISHDMIPRYEHFTSVNPA